MGSTDVHKPRVIIVDDDPVYLRVWEKIFRGTTECHYCLTNDPLIVHHLITTNTVDLVISDIVMHDRSGFDIAKSVRAAQPTTQIVLTTAYECNLKNFELTDPCFHVLYKPYRNIADIQRFIEALLKREDVFENSAEDSFSENETFPRVTEWYL